MELEALMRRKVAGVPVPVIAALIVAGLVYAAVTMRKTPDEPLTDEAPTDAAGTDTEADTGIDGQPTFTATRPMIYPTPGGSVTTVQEDNNELWGRRATEWLIAQKYPYNLAAGSIAGYLAGESLTDEQGKVRDKAVKQFGLPPEGVEFADGQHTKPSRETNETWSRKCIEWLITDDGGKVPLGKAQNAIGGYIAGHALSQDEGHIRNRAIKKFGLPPEPIRKGPPKHRHPAAGTRDNRPQYYLSTHRINTAAEIAAKNGTTVKAIHTLNPERDFPVSPKTRVRVG